MDIRPDELLRAIRLPRLTGGLNHYYRKVGTRKAQAISKVCFAGVGRVNRGKAAGVRIAVGSVAPVPLRCTNIEAVINDHGLEEATIAAAQAAFISEIAPIDDLRSTKDYRLRVALNLLKDFLDELGSLAPR